MARYSVERQQFSPKSPEAWLPDVTVLPFNSEISVSSPGWRLSADGDGVVTLRSLTGDGATADRKVTFLLDFGAKLSSAR